MTASTLATGTDASARSALTHRQIAAVALVDGFEFYDFTVYATFAVPIGRTFFPATAPWASLLLSVAVFGIGFAARPAGALFFGILADRRGRRPAMLLTVALMMVGTLGVALMPGYAVLGSAAPALIVAARLVQGFALGGEIGPSIAYLVEGAPPGRSGRAVSWPLAGHGAALLAAGLIGAALSGALPPAALDAWGWRVALIGGAGTLPAAFLLRSALPATPRARDGTAIASRLRQVAERPGTLAAAVGTVLSGSVTIYIATYLTSYASTVLGLGSGPAFAAALASGVGAFAAALAGGALADRLEWRAVVVAPRLLIALAAVPAFSIVAGTRDATALVVWAGLLAGLNSLPAAAALCAIVQAMPPRSRATGLGLAYTLGASIFGGSTQFAVTALIAWTGDPLCPGYVLALAGLTGAGAAFGLPRRG